MSTHYEDVLKNLALMLDLTEKGGKVEGCVPDEFIEIIELLFRKFVTMTPEKQEEFNAIPTPSEVAVMDQAIAELRDIANE